MLKLVSLEDLEKIIREIKSKLSGTAREAYVFGSVVEGCAIAGESDLDLLIVPDKKVDYFSLLDSEIKELLDLGLVLHIHIADNATYRHLLKSRNIRIL